MGFCAVVGFQPSPRHAQFFQWMDEAEPLDITHGADETLAGTRSRRHGGGRQVFGAAKMSVRRYNEKIGDTATAQFSCTTLQGCAPLIPGLARKRILGRIELESEPVLVAQK